MRGSLVVVGLKPLGRVFRVPDIELAGWVLKHVGKEHTSLSYTKLAPSRSDRENLSPAG
jgi:hypothetical protein